MITVTAAIIIDNGKVLAARKKTGLHLAGYWEFPGGKVEEGEDQIDCLHRELLEELGITCEIEEYLGESIYSYGEKTIRLVGYIARAPRGDFELTDHDALRWLSLDELDWVEWAPADIPLVQALHLNPHLFFPTN